MATIDDANSQISKKAFWAGTILSGLPALFLLVDGIFKLIKPSYIVEATVKLGFSESVVVPLGLVLTTCTILYLIPRTSILGAILLTGYMGGASATHVLTETGGWFSIIFPVIFGILLWGGLYLRDTRLRQFIPLRK